MYNLDKINDVAAALDSFECYCAITVALKITDDSCKMDNYEKSLFMDLYDALPTKESHLFENSVFDVIYLGRNNPSAQTYSHIKILRETAMDVISRPRMKVFKTSVRDKLLC